jgi:MFS family permease
VIGALIVNWILNRFGRCRSIQIVAAICVISAAIQGGAAHIAMFLVGRFINGVGVGMMQVTVPAYMVSMPSLTAVYNGADDNEQSELSPAKQRGRITGK